MTDTQMMEVKDIWESLKKKSFTHFFENENGLVECVSLKEKFPQVLNADWMNGNLFYKPNNKSLAKFW